MFYRTEERCRTAFSAEFQASWENQNMKIMVLGSTGLLGKALMREWRGDDVSGFGSRDADIRDTDRMREVVDKTRPDWIVLAAAYTDVDGCETHQEQALSVNRDGAVNVAEAAKLAGAKLLFLSTDYVFDGRKMWPYETEDARNPQSLYGRSKAEAEVRLLQALPTCCIARTSWLFGVGGKCFPDTILKLAATRSALDVVNDQRGCPTYSVDLARAIIELCHKNASGIVHVTNAGDCTWFEFAREIVKSAELATEVRPVSSQQMARPAPRPAYSVLSPRSLQRMGIVMPPWQDALQRYLQERRG
jgi:dTDP-4-dehydrorhamnose reductase